MAIGAISAGTWALRSGARARAHLRARGLASQPSLPPVPSHVPASRAVELALRGSRRSCLERAVVAQAWHGAHGRERDLIVGVKGPSDEFTAHAWLDGEQGPGQGWVELTRYPYRRKPARNYGGARTTVVIAVWDDPYVALLSEAIASTEHQGVAVEIVIVDNASRTTVPAITAHRRVRSERRLSRGEARNFGLHAVETEFVLFLDADDLLVDGTVLRLEQELDRNPSRAACAGWILEGEVGSSKSSGRHSVPRRFVPRLSAFRRVFALATAIWPLYSTQGGTLIRTESIASQAYDDSDGGEDWVLGVSLALRGVRVIDRPGMIYRAHSASSLSAPPRSGTYLWAAAGRVRARIRDDSAAPGLLRRSAPLLWLAHLLVVRLLVPLRGRGTDSSPGDHSAR